MTKEEARQAAKVMLAWADGKEVECKCKEEYGEWISFVRNELLTFNFQTFDYRIKPEPTYRPFKSADEVMEAIKKHGDWLERKSNKDKYSIVCVSNEDIFLHGTVGMPYIFESAYGNYTFLDGTPFGVKED